MKNYSIKCDCDYPDWVEERGLEDEDWVQERWCD